MNELGEQIKKMVVNDYFTPNIKAEVILDALLTPFIAEIIEEQFRNQRCFQGLRFVTKEMSVFDLEKSKEMSVFDLEKSKGNSSYGNMGIKIDYILGDAQAFYLVELKTTDSSINREQAKRYLSNCCGKKFGTVFGEKLLNIVKEAFGATYEKEFPEKIAGELSAWNDETLQKAYQMVFDSRHLDIEHSVAAPLPPDKKGEWIYAETAKKLIQKAGWTQKDSTRSRKYLYTIGQLLDYRASIDDWSKLPKDFLWNRPLRLIYLTPSGKLPHEYYSDYPEFYLCPTGMHSVSLKKAGEYLKEKKNDDLAQLLADIITAIYGEQNPVKAS